MRADRNFMNAQEIITLEIPVGGMDCAECSRSVEDAIRAMDGVLQAEVYLAAEKAVVHLDPTVTSEAEIHREIHRAGYTTGKIPAELSQRSLQSQSRKIWAVFLLVSLTVILIVVFGEWQGGLERISTVFPDLLGGLIVLAGGWPVYKKVLHETARRRITAQTLMTLGIIGALIIGQWITAAVIVFFMRIGDAIERSTTDRTRDALRDITALAPQQAVILRDGQEIKLSIDAVTQGDIALVRPGERIPVDGIVVSGEAYVNQSAITGEPLPVEVYEGIRVFAATIVQDGSLRVRTTGAGPDTTYGHVLKLVEEAEANRSGTQRFADRFTGYFLPLVVLAALLTLIIGGDPLAAVAVLVVSCSCAIALATPIAVMASIGAGAKNGLLIKGGRYLETLTHADVLLIDKTGTVTFGQPEITRVEPQNGAARDRLLSLAASVETLDRHPFAHAIRSIARQERAALLPATRFRSFPGRGVQAFVDGHSIRIGNDRFVQSADPALTLPESSTGTGTQLYVECDEELIGVLTARDHLRPEVPEAIQELQSLGIKEILILTGDHERSAAAIAERLGLTYRAGLLPEDKITIVKDYQAQGKTVIMVGDGVNDAPALAQADVGIAMGVAGSDVAIETADIALMRDDWSLIPSLVRIAHRTMKVVKMNLFFTGAFNLIGISLAAFGILPPVLAAASHSLPDLAILGNSARLLDQ
jgi:Cu+-exporting ATPase